MSTTPAAAQPGGKGRRSWRRLLVPSTPGDFNFGSLVQLGLFALAWLLGTLSYAWIVTACYRDVHRAYREANVLADLLQLDPGTPWGSPDDHGRRWVRSPDDKESRGRVLFRAFQLAGLAKEEETFERNEIPPGAKKLFDKFCGEEANKRFFSANASTVEMVVAWAQLIEGARENPNAGPLAEAEKFRAWTADRLASSLAQQPEVLPEFRRLASSEQDEAANIQRLQQQSGASFRLGWYYLFWPWDRTAYVQEKSPSAAELLNIVYTQTEVAKKYGALAKELPATFKEADYRFLRDSSADLLSRLQANEGVRNAKWWLALYLGPEQYVMFVLFFWMMLLMGARGLRWLRERRDKEDLLAFLGRRFAGGVPRAEKQRLTETAAASVLLERRGKEREAWRRQIRPPDKNDPAYQIDPDAYRKARSVRVVVIQQAFGEPVARPPVGLAHELIVTVWRELFYRGKEATTQGLRNLCDQARSAAARGRWLIRWIAKALPAVGFVGTVRGMLLALGNADSIVRATSQASQAAAITDVAGLLGIAFTTTFVALIMGLVTSLFNDRQLSAEVGLIDTLDRGLTPVLDLSTAVLVEETTDE